MTVALMHAPFAVQLAFVFGLAVLGSLVVAPVMALAIWRNDRGGRTAGTGLK